MTILFMIFTTLACLTSRPVSAQERVPPPAGVIEGVVIEFMEGNRGASVIVRTEFGQFELGLSFAQKLAGNAAEERISPGQRLSGSVASRPCSLPQRERSSGIVMLP